MAITEPDQKVRQNVLGSLCHDLRIDTSNLAVEVIGGVVHLYGTVPSYAQKVTAGEITRRIKGVVGIQNNLVVSFARPSSGDLAIKKAVRERLSCDARLARPDQIDILVTRGVVTLTGTAPAYDQKAAATEDTWPVEGVVNVINDIAVAPLVRRPDAEIDADVRVALAHDPSINPSNIQVSVANGTVTLRGTVPSFYQVDEATNAARRVAGVANIVNQLTVRSMPAAA